jgi:hypothetical protein
MIVDKTLYFLSKEDHFKYKIKKRWYMDRVIINIVAVETTIINSYK